MWRLRYFVTCRLEPRRCRYREWQPAYEEYYARPRAGVGIAIRLQTEEGVVVTSAIRDISERKRTEEQIRQ